MRWVICSSVTKILAKRLGLVMEEMIFHNQSVFLKVRLMLVDRIVVVNELIDLAKRSKKAYLIFKLDFEKAYDSVIWIFIHYMLIRFGFNDKWRS